MWQLIPAILYLVCVQGYSYPPPIYPPDDTNYAGVHLPPYPYNSGQSPAQSTYTCGPSEQYPNYHSYPPSFDYSSQREPGNRQQSYFEDLEMVENFGNYLINQSLSVGSSTARNEAAHQYHALLAVILALARITRNSCVNFDQVNDEVYMTVVDGHYRYNLVDTGKLVQMIDAYVSKGRQHIAKIKKLKQEVCAKATYCSVSVDHKINAAPLLYMRELETLSALSHLARTHYSYKEEFDRAAQKGTVLTYLQNCRDRLKHYVMHVVNSIEHLSEKPVSCE